jgi:hypothetical protein
LKSKFEVRIISERERGKGADVSYSTEFNKTKMQYEKSNAISAHFGHKVGLELLRTPSKDMQTRFKRSTPIEVLWNQRFIMNTKSDE